MRDYELYLRDIVEAIDRIENSLQNVTKENFKKDIDIQDAVLRRLEIIGEAVTNISLNIKEKYPKIEWKEIAGFRIIVAHAYFHVNLDIIWDIVEDKLPKLKKDVKKILKELESGK